MDIYSPITIMNCVMIASYLIPMRRMGIVIIIIRFCGMICKCEVDIVDDLVCVVLEIVFWSFYIVMMIYSFVPYSTTKTTFKHSNNNKVPEPSSGS